MNSDPFVSIQDATRAHRHSHGCGAYTFEDGPSLIRISAEVQPERILELGTGLGYTACCLASGSPTATVDTIEGDPDHAHLARDQIACAGLSGRIAVHTGDFEQILARLPDAYDLAFFDGFAPSEALMLLLRSKINSGGTLICANVGLADDQEQSIIMQELGNTARWHTMDSIEKGRTLVIKKI